MKKPETISVGDNHTAVDLGGFDSISEYRMIHRRTGAELRKVFLKELTGSTGTEISVQSLAAGEEVPYFHTHNHNEETYIVLRGQGKMQVDGDVFPYGRVVS
ncbi:MAG: cupin domain-containing protein [Rikenellaceae bacterium]|nr:cupin domain-containing protein [Rikenellaceae bacterium]